MASTFSMNRIVEFSETDMAGIVHFSSFYIWMEQAEHAFFRSLGLTIASHQTDGTTIGFPRVSASCRFVSPARFEDTVMVQLQVQRIGIKSVTYESIFSIDGRLVASGTLKTVCCRFRSGESLESIQIPDLYLSKLQEYSEPSDQPGTT
ncbi:MAG: acyl-CoA thioesterase [Fuerstiella sp.]|nr:acyl-CoA thioesterase [Fuerstiella sp.]